MDILFHMQLEVLGVFFAFFLSVVFHTVALSLGYVYSLEIQD